MNCNYIIMIMNWWYLAPNNTCTNCMFKLQNTAAVPSLCWAVMLMLPTHRNVPASWYEDECERMLMEQQWMNKGALWMLAHFFFTMVWLKMTSWFFLHARSYQSPRWQTTNNSSTAAPLCSHHSTYWEVRVGISELCAFHINTTKPSPTTSENQ